MHRDVKPANLLLARGGHVYVTDFGVAKRVLSHGGATRTGHWVGSLDYAAPEQIRGGRVDARVDVYALGGVLSFMLTGRVPFERETDEAKMYAHLADPPPQPSAIRPELPAELDDVVARAMAKQPDDRQPSTGDLGRAAAVAVHGDTRRRRSGWWRPARPRPAARRASRGSRPRRPRGRPPGGTRRGRGGARWPVWAGGGAVLAAGAAAAVAAPGDAGPRRRHPGRRPSAPPVTKGPTIEDVADRPNGVTVAGGDVWVMSFRSGGSPGSTGRPEWCAAGRPSGRAPPT